MVISKKRSAFLWILTEKLRQQRCDAHAAATHRRCQGWAWEDGTGPGQVGRWTPLALRKAMETEATAAEAESQGDYEVRCRCHVMAGEYGN